MKIHHIGIYVIDLEGAKTFFTKYFNFTAGDKYHNPRTGFSSYMLNADGDGSRLELMTRGEVHPAETEVLHVGPHHINLCIGTEKDVDLMSRRLASDGYEILDGPRRTGDGYYECCVRAVEGLLVEISAE